MNSLMRSILEDIRRYTSSCMRMCNISTNLCKYRGNIVISEKMTKVGISRVTLSLQNITRTKCYLHANHGSEAFPLIIIKSRETESVS